MTRRQDGRSNASRGSGGFTLIELLVVIVIAGVLLKISFASLPNLMSHYRLDGAARRLMADMQKARFRAIAEQKCFRVIFGPNGPVPAKSYQYQSIRTSSTCNTGGLGYAADGGIKKIDDSDFLTVASTADPIFSTRGSVLTASTITLTSTFSRSRRVQVESTGRIRIN